MAAPPDPTPPPVPPSASGRLDRTLAGRSLTNALGAVAKGLYPVYILVVTRLFGADAAGTLLLAVAVVRFTAALVGAGYKSGIVMYGGRYLHRDRPRFENAVANGVLAVLVVSAAAVATAFGAGDRIVSAYNPAYAAGGLARTLAVSSLALFPLGLAEVAVAALGASLRMRYDALVMGLARPALLVATTAAAALWFPRTPVTLAWAFAAAHVGVAVLAWGAYARHFPVEGVLRRLVRPRLDRRLLVYALPQSLNMTFSFLMSDVDLFMLGLFGIPEAVLARYAIGAQIARNVRQIKLAVGGAFAPVAARLHHEGELRTLAEVTGMMSRWALSVALPVALVVLALREEILGLFHPEFRKLDGAPFMIPLLLLPLLSCGLGLAGNLVTMAGRSHLNLLNALAAGGVNVVANLLLIPVHGLLGAALGSVAAGVTVSAVQFGQARWLLGVPLRLSPLLPAVAAGGAGAVVLFATTWGLLGLLPPAAGSAIAAAAAVVVYVAVLAALGVSPRDLAAFRRPRLG